MKYIFCLLLLTSSLLQAQNNIAFLYVNNPSTGSGTTSFSEFSETKFDLAGGMVIVEATINGQSGNFILDTGSPGIVLNAQRSNLSTTCHAAGIGGELTVGMVELQNFEWGIIKKEKLLGYVLDVSRLEASCGRKIMGLIGFDVLKNYELFFDYRNRTVKVFNSGQVRSATNLKSVKSIPFVLIGHIPVVSAKIDGKRVQLGLDSGAEVNLLDNRFFEKVSSTALANVQKEFLSGLDNEKQEVSSATVNSTCIKGYNLPEMRYLFADLSPVNRQFESSLDGLLGYSFFKNQIISIDYKKRKINIWK